MPRDISGVIAQIQRTNDIFQRARLIAHLRDEEGVRPVDIARELGLKSAMIAHYLRINRLPILVVDGYYAEMVSTSHLFTISRLPDQQSMTDVYEQVLEKNLTSSQTEELVREHLYQVNDDGSARLKKTELTSIENDISRSLGAAEVSISQSRVRARVTIEIPGNVELTTRLLRKIHRKMAEKTYEQVSATTQEAAREAHKKRSS